VLHKVSVAVVKFFKSATCNVANKVLFSKTAQLQNFKRGYEY